jgi:uncharacterized repeat protein (TIGR01451 family)
MKKTVLLLILFFASSLLFSQTLIQPTNFNNFCDTDNDGFASFEMQEIGFEITDGQSNYVVSHHLTQADAVNNVNPLPAQYTNVVNPQLIFARVFNTSTSQVDIITYNLTVYLPPQVSPQTMTVCSEGTPGLASFDLSTVIAAFVQGQQFVVTFHESLSQAQTGSSPINVSNPYFNIVPYQQILYVKVYDPNSPSCFSVTQLYLLVTDCNNNQGGQPESLTGCVDGTDNVCYDLSVNNSVILANLNPSLHSVTYHLTQADATNGLNAITSNPYCIPQGNQMMFSRLQSNDLQLVEVNTFALNGFNFQYNFTPLQTLFQCDDNFDQVVLFNLTTAQAQINSTNALAYYANSTDAQSEVNPIANPTAFSWSVFQPQTTIFIREIIIGGCDIIHSMSIVANSNCNVASSCSSANSLCNSLGIPFANTVGIQSTSAANCLGSTPNPTWFYLPISSPGTILLQVVQNGTNGGFLDVDYIVYGPFSDPVTPCGNPSQLLNNVVSCSYSSAAVENPFIPNAQPGQYYLLMVTNFSNQPGLITISELGNSQGAIDCSGIKLNAYLDENTNGTQDNGEQNFPLGQFQYEMNNNGTVHNITAPTGMYNIYDLNPANSYDVSFSVDPTYASNYAVTTSSYSNISVVIGGGLITYNFPVTITQSYNDLAIAIVPVEAPRPGFTYTNKIIYTNLGNQTLANGSLTFTKDAAITIATVSQPGVLYTSTGFTYDFTNLLPFESRTIDVVLQVPAVPVVNGGDFLTNSAAIIPFNTDINWENDSSSLTQLVINGYDPNDKMESRGPEILHATFTSDDYLYYTIRFENTGNASAINVRVNDVLDAQLDESSLRMVSASHAYSLDRIDSNLTWRFDNIQLPVSVPNTSIGKGYITFKVKPNAGYAIGDIIPNTASIYFDFNPPIITNTFTTEFTAPLSANEFSSNLFSVHPNPSNGILFVTVNVAESISKITVVDLLGKVIFSEANVNSNEALLNLQTVAKGLYLVEITTGSGLKATQKIIID